MLLLAVSGCGNDSDDAASDPPETTEAAPAETTTTTELVIDESSSEEERALAGYLAAVDAQIAAFDPPDPEHPDLLSTHTGVQLTNLQEHLRQREATGESLVVTTDVFAETADVDLVDDGSATLAACSEQTFQDVDAESGETLGDETDQTTEIQVLLRLDDGVWKVASETPIGPGPADGCAEE